MSQENSHYGPLSTVRSDSQSNARVAHELANLLDGSLRNVGLAIRALRDQADNAGDDRMMSRLETASQAMHEMAHLLQVWAGQPQLVGSATARTQTLHDVLNQAVRLLAPVAKMRSIEIQLNVADDARDLPAGPVSPVVTNALRNSVEAISMEGMTDGHIDIDCCVIDDQVNITVRDNGPGISENLLDDNGEFQFGLTTKPGGCGLGLALSRDLVQSLDGTLHMANRQDIEGTRGAELILCIPVSRLREADG